MISHAICSLDNFWQHLFQEIVIWRRPFLLALGISQELVPPYVIAEWMIGGNIMDLTLKHPEANRLRLVRPISISALTS